MKDLTSFDGDEDAALRYAIALSLQDSNNASSEKPIELSSDEDNEDLDNGPKYPPITKDSKNMSIKQPPKDAPLASQQPAPTVPDSFAALGLDRKKMEEERLARLGKRKAPEPELEGQGPRQRPKLDVESSVMVATKGKPHNLPYPKGIVKKTWATGFPRKDDIKIEEVLQKDELELAVISSFQWDEEWMFSKINCAKTKIVCVAFASSKAQVWFAQLPTAIIYNKTNNKYSKKR